MKRTRQAQRTADAKVVDNMVASEVLNALSVRRITHDPIVNVYDGYARILMEVDLLRDSIRQYDEAADRAHERRRMAAQASVVAAMAIQFVTDCCRETEK